MTAQLYLLVYVAALGASCLLVCGWWPAVRDLCYRVSLACWRDRTDAEGTAREDA